MLLLAVRPFQFGTVKPIPTALSFTVPALIPFGNVGAFGILPAAENPLPGLKLPCEVKNGISNTCYANLAWLANTLYVDAAVFNTVIE